MLSNGTLEQANWSSASSKQMKSYLPMGHKNMGYIYMETVTHR